MSEIKYYHSNEKQISRQRFRIYQAITGLTQVDIAKEIGCSQPFLSLLLKGKRTSPEKMEALTHLINSSNLEY